MKTKTAFPGLLAIASAFLLLASGCVAVSDETTNAESTSQSDSGSADESTEAQEAQEEEVLPSVYGVGDTIDFDGVEYTLNSVTTASEDITMSGPSEEIFLVLDLTIANNSSEEFSSSSLLSFDLKGSDAYTYDLAIFVDTKGSLDVAVPAGDVARGEIAFDVPQLDSYRLSVTTDFISDVQVFEILASDIG